MESNVLHSIVEITRQRDPVALENSLLTALVDAVDAVSITLLKPPMVQNSGRLDVAINLLADANGHDNKHYQLQSEPLTIELDDDLFECMDTCRTVRGTGASGRIRTLIPIVRRKKANGVVCIESVLPLDSQLPVIDAIVAVFNNYQSLIHECEHDSLTGLLNRRTFDTKLARLLRNQFNNKQTLVGTEGVREKRYHGPDSSAWLVIIDIDHFKLVNDTFGHLFGDEVILTVANKMREYFRNSDLLFRFGGEEFVAILEPTPAAMAQLTLERFRRQIANHKFPQLGRVTVSIGYARVNENDYPPLILEHADQALYYAKSSGRNCVYEHGNLLKRGRIRDERLSGSIELF